MKESHCLWGDEWIGLAGHTVGGETCRQIKVVTLLVRRCVDS